MAGEIQADMQITGATVYANLEDKNGNIWNTNTLGFESFVSGNYSSKYAISLVEQGVTGFYTGTFPPQIAAGTYSAKAKLQGGGSPSQLDQTKATGNIEWNGTAWSPRSDNAISGQVGTYLPQRIARGVQIANYPLYFKSAADHITPLVSGIVSGQIAKDGGSFGALQSGAFSEIGLGFYSLQALTSGDLLANTAALLFTAVGVSGGSADPIAFGLVLNRVSGQTIT